MSENRPGRASGLTSSAWSFSKESPAGCPSCTIPESFFRCKYLRVKVFSGMVNEKSDEANPVIGFVQLRREKGVTQRQIADALDLSERTVIDWESGKRIPKLYVWQIKKLCILLDVSIFEMPDSFEKTKK